MSGTLADSPSDGKSEVLATLRAEGRSIPFRRLCERLQFDWGIGTDTFSTFPTTVAGVLSALQTAEDVTGTTADGSASVDLTDGVPADTDRVALTQDGLTDARHLSPRPQKDPFGRS